MIARLRRKWRIDAGRYEVWAVGFVITRYHIAVYLGPFTVEISRSYWTAKR